MKTFGIMLATALMCVAVCWALGITGAACGWVSAGVQVAKGNLPLALVFVALALVNVLWIRLRKGQ